MCVYGCVMGVKMIKQEQKKEKKNKLRHRKKKVERFQIKKKEIYHQFTE